MTTLNFVYEHKYTQLGYFPTAKLLLFAKLKRKIAYYDELNFKKKTAIRKYSPQ